FSTPGLSASARYRQHLITGQIGSLYRFRGLCECTVMTNIAAQFGEGDEHLARVSEVCAMRVGRHRFAGIQQVRKRTFPKRRNNRLAGSSGEFVKIPGHIISLAAAKPRIVFNGSAWPGKAAMNVDTPKPSSLRNMSVTISWGPAV